MRITIIASIFENPFLTAVSNSLEIKNGRSGRGGKRMLARGLMAEGQKPTNTDQADAGATSSLGLVPSIVLPKYIAF